MDLIQAILEERRSEKITLFEGGGGFNMRFRFATADVRNANKRTYPLKVLGRAVAEAQAKISKGSSLYGSCDHKTEMGVDDVSHRLTKLEMESKDAVATAAVLKTVKGHNLQAIIAGGGSLGVSMRGIGTVVKDVVQEDFILHGVDVVLSPSFDVYISAKNVFESQEFSPERITEGLERRYELALRSGYRGSQKDFMDTLAGEKDETKLSALYQGALRAGYRGTYPEFRKSYVGRKT